MSERLSFFLADLSTYIGLVPVVLAFFRFKTLHPEQRRLAILVWVGVGIGISADWVSRLFFIPNLFLLHLYTIVNFVLLTWVYQSVVGARWARVIGIAFTVFAAVNSLFIEGLQTFNVLSRSISTFISMFFALRFFAKSLREMQISRLEMVPLFWISVGTLFYNAASFFIFLFSKDIAPHEPLSSTYFGIHAIFTVLLYIFYTIALWIRPTE